MLYVSSDEVLATDTGQVDLEGSRAKKFRSSSPCSSSISHALKACSSSVCNHLSSVDYFFICILSEVTEKLISFSCSLWLQSWHLMEPKE